MAAIATAAPLLLQLTKPHERWRLVRHHQGLLEIERFRYLHRLRGYADGNSDSDSLFLEQIAGTSTALEKEWAGLMPESRDAAQLLGKQ